MEFIDRSPENTELAKALLQVQRQMSPAVKDGKNPFTRSNYATLNSVMESCREALLNNNIWLCQYPVPVDAPGCIGLMTKLTHTESGQWQASLAVVPLPKEDPQGMGSAITYSRRYALTAMLGMVTEDDDGEAAKLAQKSATRPKSSSQSANRQNAKTPDTQPDFDVPVGTGDLHNDLPQLQGIAYQTVTAQDGRECVIATGDTRPNRAALTNAGFRWNPQRQLWWKYANAS